MENAISDRAEAHAPIENSETARTRARTRITLACDPCRRRKVKCDGSLPCQKCTAAHKASSCLYSQHARGHSSRGSLARPLAPKQALENIKPNRNDTERGTSSDAGHDDPVANKKQQELRAGIAAFNSDTHAYQFYGPSSHFSFVQRLYQRIRRQSHQPLMLEVHNRRVPDGLRQWGVERQLFAHGDDNLHLRQGRSEGSLLPQDLGEAFISTYFNIMHPQAPILVEAEVLKAWHALWKPPERPHVRSNKAGKERSVLYMVLAIGARLLDHNRDQSLDGWAEYFHERACTLTDLFEETSLVVTHLLLLQAIYAMQIGRANSVYLYLGHAARSATALGLHRSQVVAGSGGFLNRLRTTFWTIYYMERMTAMLSGRPTCLSDEHIDAPLPDDQAQDLDSRPIQYAYIRAMSVLGKISDTVMTSNYSPKTVRLVSELSTVNVTNKECIEAMQHLLGTLPLYLHFFDQASPLGEEWQEVQRTCLGMSYHITRILIYRPALIYVTFFDSLALAQESIGDRIDIKNDMDLAVLSAKSLIALTHEAFFRRCPAMKRDGNLAFFIVSACLTLLFEVLDPATTPAHAREVFQMVDKGLQCLDRIDNIGSSTGRAISMDVMKIAKDALLSTEAEKRLESDLVENFTWLNDNTFDEFPLDNTGSWLYNAIGIPELGSGLGENDAFLQNPMMEGSSDPNQLVFDMMGEGLRFADSPFNAAHVQH